MSIREEFFVERQGRTMVLYAGLLQEAHERGLVSISTELLEKVMDDEGEPVYAVARATVLMSYEGQDRPDLRKTFTGIGDATRRNVGRMIVPHLIRMAETRAKARALRDAINVGVTALEELGGDEEPSSSEAPAEGSPAREKKPSSGEDRAIAKSQISKIEWLCKQLKYKTPDLEGFTEADARDLIEKLEAEKKKKREAV